MPTTTLRRAPHITSLITIAALASFSTACFSPDEQATGDSSTGELSATASGTAPDASTATSGQTGPDTQSSGPETTDADDATESSGDNSDTTTSGSAEETTGAPDDDTTGEPDASSDDSSGTIVDSPSIVEVTPADGAIGVHADTTIVVQFSTEMDKASAQAAFQSADLPAAAVTFDWNDAGDQLTITPNAPLDYAQGDSPASTDALTYSFSLTTAAESEAGEALASDIDVSFSTLRRLSAGFEDDPNLSGRIRDLGGAVLLGGSYLLGDNTSNDPARGFVTFDVSSLPAGPLTIESAAFHARWSQQSGNPFIDLGAVVYQHVAYSTFNDALFDAPGIGSASGLFGTAQQDDVERDVTDIVSDVLADEATYDDRVQFRMLWFLTETDGDNQSDGVTVVAGDLGLELTYLAP